jgi:putative hemolysin
MSKIKPSEDIFSIVRKNKNGAKYAWLSFLCKPLEQMLSLRRCSQIYATLPSEKDPVLFIKRVLNALSVRPSLSPNAHANIPEKNPAVVIANHPFGAIEGIVLADLMLSVRRDVKILANSILHRIPQLQQMLIPVDPFNTRKAVRANIGPIRNAIEWVKDGGMLIIFPAGEVAHIKLSSREISDPPWNTGVGRIIHKTNAPVLPVFFKGSNSPLFQALGIIHPRLRTTLLPRELMNKQHKAVELKIGKPIPYRWLKNYETDTELLDYLRWRTYLLGYAFKKDSIRDKLFSAISVKRLQPIAKAQNPDRCAGEIDKLPKKQMLMESGNFTVWQAKSDQIPYLLLEIGRLREISFRMASEGTGKSLDLDPFDTHYFHIFVWNRIKKQVVGAYRLAQTDVILQRYGQNGLYTTTLFKSSSQFYNKIGPALELGRSFVNPDYQKSYSSLLLLWKGIGRFIVDNPRYKILFGPVSISRDFTDLSRHLIATTLLKHSQAKDLALLVRPRKPLRSRPIAIRGCSQQQRKKYCKDIKEVFSIIADIELDNKDIPVLLRHYLNLGGQLLCFGEDKSFSRVMDGLIIVDLLQTDEKTLRRYMGRKGVETFLHYHQYALATKAG